MRRRLSAAWMVIHPVLCEQEFEPASGRFSVSTSSPSKVFASELLQLLTPELLLLKTASAPGPK